MRMKHRLILKSSSLYSHAIWSRIQAQHAVSLAFPINLVRGFKARIHQMN